MDELTALWSQDRGMGTSPVRTEKGRTLTIFTLRKHQGESAEAHCFLPELSKAGITPFFSVRLSEKPGQH